MESEELVKKWFDAWENGDIDNLPITDDFSHHSPFGIISGKSEYLSIVKANKEKFLNNTFEILDGIYEAQKACVRYLARQGNDFKLEVSEWYYLKENKIGKINSYYHIGDIRDERKLEHQ